MKRAVLLLILSIVFLINFVSADVSVSTNTTYYKSQVHSPNSVEGVLFVPEANFTLINVTRNSIASAPFCVVFDGKTNVTIANSIWVNNICNVNVPFVKGNLYRIGTGTNATTNYITVYNQTYSINYNPTNGTNGTYGFLKYYLGIGNFTGGCYSSTCNVYAIASTLYNIESITLGDPLPPGLPSSGDNLTVENLNARIIDTQNFSADRVTKSLTFFSDFALIFRDITQRIWSPIAGTLNIDASNLVALRSPTTNVTGNLTVGQLVKLNSAALPACNAATDGSLARNVTGMLVFCDNGKWKRITLKN